MLLPRRVADEVVAAVEAALDNVRQHAGDDARAWVLLDDDGDEIAVTIRDSGRGVPAGRLEEAVGQGRLGVSSSIVGRLADLGGTATITSGPSGGTTVEPADPQSPDGTSDQPAPWSPDARDDRTGDAGPHRGTRSIVTEQEDAMPQQGSSTPPEHIRVVVADDHPMWRDAVARDLADAGFEVLATADDGRSAVARTRATVPDVLVLDLNLPGLSGAEVCAALAAAQVPTRILILSASGDHQDVLDAVKAGALGYLVKSAGREEFLAAVRATAAGEPVFTAGLAGLVLGEFRRVKAAGGGSPERPIPEPDRPRDRDPQVRRDRHGLQGDRGDAVPLAPHRAEPRAEHLRQGSRCTTASRLVRFAMERGLDLADPT